MVVSDFMLTDELKSDIERSMAKYKDTVSGLKLKSLDYTRYGGNFVKSKKISPDALIQLAFQV